MPANFENGKPSRCGENVIYNIISTIQSKSYDQSTLKEEKFVNVSDPRGIDFT